jgi:hypothetical protein
MVQLSDPAACAALPRQMVLGGGRWRPAVHLPVWTTASVMASAHALCRPAFNETERSHILSTANLVFLAIFTAEASLKILAMGLLLHPGAYLRDGCATMAGMRHAAQMHLSIISSRTPRASQMQQHAHCLGCQEVPQPVDVNRDL